ncbi:MAG: hypothetical protein ACFB10_26870 [Salibacteraceae bacterium]
MSTLIALILFSPLSLTFIGCQTTNKNTEVSEELEKLKSEKEALQAQADSQNEMIDQYLQSVNLIEANLDEIKKREGIVNLSYQDDEIPPDQATRIAEDINAIGRLMQENREQIQRLQNALKASNVQIQGLESMVSRLTKVLAQKDNEIRDLRQELIATNQALDELFNEYSASLEVINEQTEILNTAWFAYGSAKELKNNGVITKEGGFVGIGGAKKLKNDFNRAYFQKIDITKVDTLELYGKKAKLITTHPTESYKLIGEGEAVKLVIKLPETFWSASKYLVVQVD